MGASMINRRPLHQVLVLALGVILFACLIRPVEGGFLSSSAPQQRDLVPRQDPTSISSESPQNTTLSTSSVTRPPRISSGSEGEAVSTTVTTSTSSVTSVVTVTSTAEDTTTDTNTPSPIPFTDSTNATSIVFSNSTSTSTISTTSSPTPSPTSTQVSQRVEPTRTATSVTATSISSFPDAAVTFSINDSGALGSSPTSFQPDPPTESSSPSNVGGASNSNGFWSNKGAVAGTFVVVSLIIAAIFALGFIHFMRNRNSARQRRLHAQLFEKYTARSPTSSTHGFAARNNSSGYSDNSRFKGAEVTSDYPFAQGSSRMGGSASTPQGTGAKPPSLAQSDGSQYTASWTPDDFQFTLSAQPYYNNNAATPHTGQYLLPSQSIAALKQPSTAAPSGAFKAPNSQRLSIDSFYGYRGASPAGGSGQV